MKKKPSKSKPKASGKAKPKKKETLKQIYARIKREFSAADLQRFTVDEPMVPARQVLAELEAINAKYSTKRRAS
jgi:hypothetical protein